MISTSMVTFTASPGLTLRARYFPSSPISALTMLRIALLWKMTSPADNGLPSKVTTPLIWFAFFVSCA